MASIPIILGEFTEDAAGDAKNVDGGIYQVVCENVALDGDADYGGGTVTLQTSHAGGGWQDVYAADGALLEINADNDYASTLTIRSSLQIRATLAGATSPDVVVKLV